MFKYRSAPWTQLLLDHWHKKEVAGKVSANIAPTTTRPDMYALTPYPITPIGNFIGVVLALLPLISQIRKLSLAVWGYALWIAVDNFQMFREQHYLA